jgi:hypothetical protein
MIDSYIYVFLLIVVLILLFTAIYLTKLAPKKIKTITMFIILAMLLRYFSLLILFLSSSVKYLYLLKVFFFLNLISIPLLALTVLYVFIRKDNVNFSYIFIIASILLVLYSAAMYKCPGFLQTAKNYGYTMFFLEHMYIYWIYIVLNTIILFIVIGLISEKNVIKIGMYFMVISSIVTILELIMWTMGIVLLQEIILGDVLWISTLVYALNKVKKRTRE